VNGWGQFFLGLLLLAFLAGTQHRWIRYRITRKMVEEEYSSEDIVNVMEGLNRDNPSERYIDSEDGE